jgi:hypothetical protein
LTKNGKINNLIFKRKDLTFKISMVYDGHHFHDAQYPFILEKNSKKEGGDLNDKGGVNRQRGEGGQDLESGS